MELAPGDQPHTIQIQALDIYSYSEHWPYWSDAFQVHVAVNYDDQLEDEEKLSVFLKSLGEDGSALASSIYPLINRSAATDQDAFDEVWWRMRELWYLAKDVERSRRRTRNILKQRRQLPESTAQDIEQEQEKWLLLIPHLSLCELEYVAKTVPRLEQIVRNYSSIFGVRIEKCCLEKYSVHTDKEVFAKYESISAVTLKHLPESDAIGVLQVFKNIKKFTMHNMVIIEDINGFPGQLLELNLVGCKIERELMDRWTSSLNSTMMRLCLVNFKHTFSLVLPEDVEYYYNDSHRLQYSSDILRSLSVKDEFIYLDVQARGTQFLSTAAENVRNFDVNFPYLTHVYLHLDITLHECLYYLQNYPSTVKFLPIRKWIPLQEIQKFSSLEYLWIMCPVNPKYKEEIDQLKIKTVVVNYQHEPDPSEEEPNLIFEMLNEYCWLEITDYLSVPDWMRFGQLHWKAEMALCSYKYPSVELTLEDIECSGICTDSDHFNYVAQFVRKSNIQSSHLLVKFPSLKSCCINRDVEADVVDVLPSRLEKLSFFGCRDNFDWQPYFRKLNSTLTVLDLIWSPGLDCLSELTNLQEIEINNDIPIDHVMLMLKQNPQLHRIHIFLYQEGSWNIPEEIFQQIGTMKELKDLAIIGFLFTTGLPNESRIVVADLWETVGSRLTKLSCYGPDFTSMSTRGFDKNLEELHLWGMLKKSDVIRILPVLCSMTTLKKLRCAFDNVVLEDFNFFEDSELLLLIESLPCLSDLELPGSKYTIRFEMRLLEYLKTMKRQLRINKTTIA